MKSVQNTNSNRYTQNPHLYEIISATNDSFFEIETQYREREKRVEITDENFSSVLVYDVAAYILFRLSSCTMMKLHKLLYYCQAWSLVWDDGALFNEPIEAWANGPVIRELFAMFHGLYIITYEEFNIGDKDKLSSKQQETINAVLDVYADKSAQWLVDQTHTELPWVNARKGLQAMERGNVVISLESMLEYYSCLH